MKPNQISKEVMEEQVLANLIVEEIKETNLLREVDAMFREGGVVGLTWIGNYCTFNLEDETEEE